ncbi:hypothetical protein FBU59_003265, partial [Linderina macrospora]
MATRIASEEPDKLELPAAVYARNSPLIRVSPHRRRSTLNNLLDAHRRKPEEPESPRALRAQRAQRESGAETHASNGSDSSTLGGSPMMRTTSLQPGHTGQAGQMESPRILKAELQFRYPPQGHQQERAASMGLDMPSTSNPGRGHRHRKQLPTLVGLEGNSLGLTTDDAAHDGQQSQYTPSLRTMSKQYPYRVERSYRNLPDFGSNDGGLGSDDREDLGSDRDMESPRSTSPVSFLPPFEAPSVVKPPVARDVPPLPEDLQHKIQMLPRLSPPRKAPFRSGQHLGMPEPPSPTMAPADMVASASPMLTNSSARRVVSGSSLMHSPSKRAFNTGDATTATATAAANRGREM